MRQNQLLTKVIPKIGGMVERNHLGQALISRPQELMGTMDRIFSSYEYASDNPLTGKLMLSDKTMKRVGGTEWTWNLRTSSLRPAVVIENENGSETAAGNNQREFKLKLDVNWYLPGDILTPGTSDQKYQARIVDHPIADGDGFIYRLVLATNNPADFVPSSYLAVGQKWSKIYSKYEEGSVQAGSTQYSFPISFRNKLSKLKKEYKVTDHAASEVLAIGLPDSKGMMHKAWIPYAEVEFWRQWYREIELNAWYSRTNTLAKGSTGRNIDSGAGIQQQLEDSNIHYYSELSVQLLEEYISDIYFNRITPGKRPELMVYTGEVGLRMFDRAVRQVSNANSGFTRNIEPFQKNVKSEYHKNALTFGFQYTEYMMTNGGSIKLVHNPLYDDTTIHTQINPRTSLPVESQRFTFLDFVDGNRGDNIKMIKKINGDAFGYHNGLYGNNGPAKGDVLAHTGDFYTMVMSTHCGVNIEDVTRCGELKFSV